MGKRLNAKYELVALGVVEGKTLEQIAQAAGYRTKYAYSHVCRIARYPEVTERIRQLQSEAATEIIMSVNERLQRLSQIARARYNDPDRDGDPIRAIAEMNRMQKIYDVGTNVNIEQRNLNINVISEASRQVTQQITDGARTCKEADDKIDTQRPRSS